MLSILTAQQTVVMRAVWITAPDLMVKQAWIVLIFLVSMQMKQGA